MSYRKDRVEETGAPCALRERCQSHCVVGTWLTGELGRINQALCEIEEAFILAADEVASAMMAEACPTFVDAYYRRPYRAPEGANLTRIRRPGEPGPTPRSCPPAPIGVKRKNWPRIEEYSTPLSRIHSGEGPGGEGEASSELNVETAQAKAGTPRQGS
ncbi:MAG TPA: hypothetical protein VF518_02325, partial [Polyangia bacterium]